MSSERFAGLGLPNSLDTQTGVRVAFSSKGIDHRTPFLLLHPTCEGGPLRYTIISEPYDEGSVLTALDLPGCGATGKTEPEVRERIRTAIESTLAL